MLSPWLLYAAISSSIGSISRFGESIYQTRAKQPRRKPETKYYNYRRQYHRYYRKENNWEDF